MTKKGGKKDKQPTKPKEIKEVEVKETPDLTNDNEGDLNSGFSSYLQSSSGINQLNSTKKFLNYNPTFLSNNVFKLYYRY